MSITPEPISNNQLALNRQLEARISSLQENQNEKVIQKKKASRGSTLRSTKKIEESKKQAKGLIKRLIQNIYFQVFITLLTLASLFLSDLKTIFLNKEQDTAMDIASLCIFSIFSIQIALNTRTEGYFLSFFFFLDLISTLTMLLDIDMITQYFYSGGGNFQVSSLVAQSRASRAAARAVRITKIFRLARVVKVYKSATRAKQLNQLYHQQIQRQKMLKMMIVKENTMKQQLNKDDAITYNDSKIHLSVKHISIKETMNLPQVDVSARPTPDLEQIRQQDHENEPNSLSGTNQALKSFKTVLSNSNPVEGESFSANDQKQSNISKILSQNTITKIIIVILCIMLSIPLLTIDNYYTQSTGWDFMVNWVGRALSQKQIPISDINKVIAQNLLIFSGMGYKDTVVSFNTPFNEVTSLTSVNISSLRMTDLSLFTFPINISNIMQCHPELTLSSNNLASINIIINYAEYNRVDAAFSIATTCFVCLTILYLLNEFSKHITELVIAPIEKMLSLVKRKEENIIIIDKNQGSEDAQQYETGLVEAAIIKIKALMITIFGPIGNDLIHENLFSANALTTSITETSKPCFCVYVLCKLAAFSKIIQLLEDDIFSFANDIAAIVHNAAFRYGGYCVKNYDDGFMLVFPIPEEVLDNLEIDEDVDAYDFSEGRDTSNTYLNIMCDYALFSCVKILARIRKDPKILKYKNDQRLLLEFGSSFNFGMHFALTVGWSYEGVMGSSYKIDPLFIGPKINQLQKLMKISQISVNSIVMGEDLQKNLTNGCKKFTRRFDKIKMSQNERPEQLFVVDMDLSNVSPSRSEAEKKSKNISRPDLKMKKQINMDYLRDQIQISNYNAQAFVNNKKQLREILKKTISQELKRKYNIGFDSYLNGEWKEAKQNFGELLKIIRHDQLTQRIYNYIKASKDKVPIPWQGYRSYENIIRR